MKLHANYIKFIIISMLVLILGYFTINKIEKHIRTNHLQMHTDLLKSKFDINYQYFKIMSDDIYSMYKDDPLVIESLSYSNNLKDKKTDILRKKLYKKLKKRYKRLTNMGIHQLQFHLPNNVSFLRMNDPKKYGDDLSDIRQTVVKTNSFLIPTEGFEFGRKVYGFRFIYPLFDKNNKHIGSMGISYSAKQLFDTIIEGNNQELLNYDFFINKKMLYKKIWDYKKPNSYRESKINPNLYYDLSIHKNLSTVEDYESLLDNLTIESIKKHMELEKPFSIEGIINNESVVISFLPLMNDNCKCIAYLNTYHTSNYLDHLNIKINDYKTLFYIIILLISLFGLYIIKLHHQVTKERNYQKAILDTNPNIIITTSGNTLLSANQSFFNILKYKDIKSFLEDHDCICDFFVSFNGKEVKDKSVDGKLWTQYILSAPEIDHIVELNINNEIYNYKLTANKLNPKEDLIIFTDITKLKKQEEYIKRHEKLVSIAEFINNITHHWRQKLSIISTCATGLQIKYEHNLLEENDLKKNCFQINNTAQSLSENIKEMSFFNKESEKSIFNIKTVIKDSIHSLNTILKDKKINCHLEFNDDIKLYSYQNELKMCLLSIIHNSIDALDEIDEQRHIFISLKKEKNHAIISIKDNGGGIDQDVLPKIFEPYFTTKHKYFGTGMGLYLTYNFIIGLLKGKINVSNESFMFNEKQYKGTYSTIELDLSIQQ